jgi:hypothetical protein
LSHAADAIEEVGLLVFDECHLLSPKGGGKRSLDAMLCLLHALKRAPDADLLLLSAMLTNATEFAEWIQESTGRPCTAYQNPWKPSRQARGVVVYRRQDLGNIANSREMIPYGLFGLHQHWSPQVAADLRLVSLSSENVTLARSRRGWATPNANGVANALAIQASRAGLKTIVFVQQADYAPTNAKKIADALDAPSALTAAEDLLWTRAEGEGEIAMGPRFVSLSPSNKRSLCRGPIDRTSVVDGNILNSNGVHVGVVVGDEVFGLKGQKLYDLKGSSIYKVNGDLVGHLSDARGAQKRLDKATDKLFPST